MIGPMTRTVALVALLAQLLWPRYFFVQIAGKGISGYTAMSILLLVCAMASFIVRRRFHRNVMDGMLRSKILIAAFVLLWAWRLICDFAVGNVSQAVQTAINFLYIGSWFVSGMIIFADEKMRAALPYFLFLGALGATVAAAIEVQTGTPIARVLGLSGQSYLLNSFADDMARGGTARVRSLFVHPILYGQFLAGLLPFALYFFFAGRMQDKVLGLLLAAFIAAALLWSNARSPLIVAVVGAGCFMAFYLFDLRRRARLFFAVIGLSLVVASTPLGLAALEQIQSGRTSEEANSTTGRKIQMERGQTALRKSPIMGFGEGAAIEYASTRNDAKQIASVDNYFLSSTVDFGYGGLATLLLFLTFLVFQGVRAIYSTPWNRMRTLNCAVLSSAIALVAGLTVISIDDTLSLVFLMAGFLIAASGVPAVFRREERAARARMEAAAIPEPA